MANKMRAADVHIAIFEDRARQFRRAENAEAELAQVQARLADSKKVQEVYRTLLVAGMREVVRLSDALDEYVAARAYYAKLFELAQESGDLDKCDEAAIAAVAQRAGVPIEYTSAVEAEKEQP